MYIGIAIDGYTHNSTLTSGESVPLGTQIILVCQVVGLPYGTPLSYTWTCPNGPCEVEGYYGRKVYSEHILAVNTTSTRDGGTYTCQVTATGGQEVAMSFTISVTGKRSPWIVPNRTLTLTAPEYCLGLPYPYHTLQVHMHISCVMTLTMHTASCSLPIRWSCCSQLRKTHSS